ncbi:RDD family protein [Shewanella mesophila]|uniref:RDD family protein n=1 Tax=Shewanella mesophila TaxID=2864208 RepID=UPI001C659546|nr:RDD family protein [Shewanella mesophila]
MVTPFAFNIAPSVLYTPLASPVKRGIAIAIDGLLISVLAEQAGWLFILLVGLTLLIERRSHQIGKAFKWALYFSMLIMTIWVTSDNLIEYKRGSNAQSDSINDTIGIREPSVSASLKILPDILALTMCETRSCAETKLVSLMAIVEGMSITAQEKRQMLLQVISELELSQEDISELSQLVVNRFPMAADSEAASSSEVLDSQADKSSDNLSPQEVGAQSPSSPTSNLDRTQISGAEPLVAASNEVKEQDNPVVLPANDQDGIEDNDKQPYSVLGWAKGLLNDLGLGFGWAAFYFTVFTAWFDGQTLGKKLLNIRVIQLDASKISLWDAFGRYGGYGAGFATGLLGFMQIYWDANRQAIQDKISATVVIDLSKTKQIPDTSAVFLGEGQG